MLPCPSVSSPAWKRNQASVSSPESIFLVVVRSGSAHDAITMRDGIRNGFRVGGIGNNNIIAPNLLVGGDKCVLGNQLAAPGFLNPCLGRGRGRKSLIPRVKNQSQKRLPIGGCYIVTVAIQRNALADINVPFAV